MYLAVQLYKPQCLVVNNCKDISLGTIATVPTSLAITRLRLAHYLMINESSPWV